MVDRSSTARRHDFLLAALRGTYGLRLLLDRRVQVVLTAAVLLVVGVVRVGQLLYSSEAWQIGYDFSAYWLAGVRLLEDQPIYTAEQLSGTYPAQQQFLYLYPPLLAILVAPLAALFPGDYQDPAWVWAAVGGTSLIVSVLLLSRAAGVRDLRTLLVVLALGIALPPVALELLMGNVHLLLLALLAATWLGLRAHRPAGDFLAAISLALATLVKVFPGLLLIWLVATGHWRLALLTVAAILALLVASVPIVGLEAWLAYPTVLLHLSPPADPSNVLAPTVWLAEVTGPAIARGLVLVAGVIVLAWSARHQTRAISFAVAILVSLAVAPALYLHYLALTVLPLLIAFGEVGLRPSMVMAYVALFVGTQASLWQPDATGARALATVGFLVVLGVLLTVRPARDESRDTNALVQHRADVHPTAS